MVLLAALMRTMLAMILNYDCDLGYNCMREQTAFFGSSCYDYESV